MVAQIQAHKFYPDFVRSRRDQGRVGVSFTIGPSGRVGSASVVRSSGFAELDSAAREILQSISPPSAPRRLFPRQHDDPFPFRVRR